MAIDKSDVALIAKILSVMAIVYVVNNHLGLDSYWMKTFVLFGIYVVTPKALTI